MICLGSVSGYVFTPTYNYCERYKTGVSITLNCATKKFALVNDSRKENKRVQFTKYQGKVYCVEVPGNVLIVRRAGRVCLSGNSSPAEHQAKPQCTKLEPTGNFKVWVQYRKTLEDENIEEFKGPLG